MLLGHDPVTKHTFGYDNGNIQYLGRTESTEQSPCDEVTASVLAAAMTSGFTASFITVYMDGNTYEYVNPAIPVKASMRHIAFVGVPSYEVLDENPTAKVHVLNMESDTIVALGYLFANLCDENIRIPDRRMWFLEPNVGEVRNAQPVEYDQTIVDEGEPAGKMARYCKDGIPVLNERFTTPMKSAFHDRLLVRTMPDDRWGVYLIPLAVANACFPSLPVSWRYAACCCPVLIENTDIFRVKTGDANDKITVRFIGPSDDLDMVSFGMFWNIMTEGGVAAVSLPKERAGRCKRLAVFRHDKAYLLECI